MVTTKDPENIGFDEWYDQLDAKVYLWSSDRIPNSMKKQIYDWYYEKGLTVEKAILEWMRIHPLD